MSLYSECGEKLETVNSLKNLRSVVSGEGSRPELEIISKPPQRKSAMLKLRSTWNDRNLRLSLKIRLMRSQVISVFLYARESWISTAQLERRIQITEMKCYPTLLGITYKDHTANADVRKNNIVNRAS